MSNDILQSKFYDDLTLTDHAVCPKNTADEKVQKFVFLSEFVEDNFKDLTYCSYIFYDNRRCSNAVKKSVNGGKVYCNYHQLDDSKLWRTFGSTSKSNNKSEDSKNSNETENQSQKTSCQRKGCRSDRNHLESQTFLLTDVAFKKQRKAFNFTPQFQSLPKNSIVVIKGVLKPHNKPNTQSTFSKKSVASPITRNFVLSPSSGTILTFPKVSMPRKPLNIAKIKQLSPCQRKRRSDVTLRSFKDVIDTEGLQMDEEVKSEADSYNSLTPPFKWIT